MTYDIEKLLSDLKAITVANLDAKLAAIDAEKADNISLLKVPSDAYLFQSLTKAQANKYPVFIHYGYDDPVADGLGPYTVEELEVFFIVMLKNTAEDQVYLQRMMRYSRALKEIFQENFSNTPWKNKIKVSSVAPISFQIQGITSTFLGAGVKVWTKF